jgi:glycosyltransferase involved in cell wall biosynthesis
MSTPRVSVAMATCEGSRFVETQLESIAGQTRPPDELVVCDDASRDDTFARLESFAARTDLETRVLRNPVRLGITANFERVVSACTGDVIFLADQDDVWLPEKIATLTDVLVRRPELGAVFSDGEVVDAELSPRGYTLWESLGFDEREREQVRRGDAVGVFLRHVVAAGTTLAFRAGFRELALPFPPLRSCHDAFIAFVVAALAPIEIVETPLIRYRVHDRNQIGIRRLGLREQLAKAREQLASDAFGYAVEFFEAARARLTHAPPDVLHRIDEKILHARRRQAMSPHWLARLRDIHEEARSGRYRRYSYGWKSIAQDLWLR